ncbi:MAG TPA: thioredoxin [Xanthomonadaceae bacterium]|nr:thioredoxin [Xanthomonadaceae bacterium]
MNLNVPAPTSFDVSTERFEIDVLAKSREVPILIDFWAEWCAPCRQLKPVLEKVVAEYGGRVLLAKVDTDKEGQVAAVFGVRSLPTVILMKDGQPVDGFMGAQPEGAVREFLSRHLGLPAAKLDGEFSGPPQDQAFETPEHAVARLREELVAAPDRDELKLELALALLRSGAADEAETLLDTLPAKLSEDDRARRARSQLAFARVIGDAPPRADLERRINGNPADLDARHKLGVRMLLDGDTASGLEQFLEILQRDRGFGDDLGRRSLIDAFRIIEDEDLVGRFRRRMSSLLF